MSLIICFIKKLIPMFRYHFLILLNNGFYKF